MQSTDAKTRDMPARLEMIGGATREAELAILNQFPFTGKDEWGRIRTRKTGRAYAVFIQPRYAVFQPTERWQSDDKSDFSTPSLLTRNSLPEMWFQKSTQSHPTFAKSQKRRFGVLGISHASFSLFREFKLIPKCTHTHAAAASACAWQRVEQKKSAGYGVLMELRLHVSFQSCRMDG
jgi:hypothetical protein